jgi:methylenetetrahydrofolate dehydrogenase (NADP+) / methenyltetrahydrofolate cyclohydrolase
MNFVRIDGREIAEKLYIEFHDRVVVLKNKNVIPHLVVILVGENPASVAYVTLKQQKGEAIGAKVTLLKYPTDIKTDELARKIEELNDDKTVHGILIQRPLPEHIDIEKLELLTNPEKDIDGFHPDSPYTLPLPLAVVKILEEVYKFKNNEGVASAGDPHRAPGTTKVSEAVGWGKARQDPEKFQNWLRSQNIVVLGKGPTGGGPIIKLLGKLGVNPEIIDSKTDNPEELMKNADIIISSVGRENVIKPENIKKGVILIGVGILRGEDRKLKGDYDIDKIKEIAGYYTPTPGGVGPVNVAMLLDNLLTAAEHQTR